MSGDVSFAERLVTLAAREGVLFSGPFCAIYWLKKRGPMPGLTCPNELTSRNEDLHAEFADLLYGMLQLKLPNEVVHEIIRGEVHVEREFICKNVVGGPHRYEQRPDDRVHRVRGGPTLQGPGALEDLGLQEPLAEVDERRSHLLLGSSAPRSSAPRSSARTTTSC